MEFFELIHRRHSIRSFASRPIAPDQLQAILEAANRAPSAGNLQAYEIYAVTSSSHRLALAQAALEQEFLAQAPVNLVFCAHPQRSAMRYGGRGARLYALQDATIACTFAMLAATSLGLGSVWVGAFDETAVRRIIGASPDLVPIAILAIGHAAEKPTPTPRRQLSDLVHYI